MFAAIHAANVSQTLLLECAREFSPCVESTAPGIILLDLQGTEKLLGPPQDIGKQISRRAKELGVEARIAIAANPDAAQYAALGFGETTFISSGQERERLAVLPVHMLTSSPEMLETLDGWH